jgi:hypothetical protein
MPKVKRAENFTLEQRMGLIEAIRMRAKVVEYLIEQEQK